MKRYLIKRMIGLFLVLFGVSVLSFVLASIANPNPALTIARSRTSNPSPELVASIQEEYRLDESVFTRYFLWLEDILKGDLGVAYINSQPVIENFQKYLPKTLILCGLSMVITIVFTLLLGLLCACYQNSIFDHLMRIITVLGLCLPVFWLGYLLLIVFALWLDWFTITPEPGLKGYLLPAITLALPLVCTGVRLFRSGLLSEYQKDYCTYLRSRGMSTTTILTRHAITNALPPVLTLFASYGGYLLAGTAVVESVFTIHGLGNHLVSGIMGKDIPTISGATLLIAVTFVVLNFIADMLNMLLRKQLLWEDSYG